MLGQMIAEIFFVFPWGVEPQSSEPESEILSIELRAPVLHHKVTEKFRFGKIFGIWALQAGIRL